MPVWILVVLGGALGSGARHAVNLVVAQVLRGPAHYATLTVNVAGCAVAGLFAGLIASGRLTLDAPARAFLFVGVLGGFTTFSAFGLDTYTLASQGYRAAAAWNVAAHVALGLAALAGMYVVASRA
jgi:CrcB protein